MGKKKPGGFRAGGFCVLERGSAWSDSLLLGRQDPQGRSGFMHTNTHDGGDKIACQSLGRVYGCLNHLRTCLSALVGRNAY